MSEPITTEAVYYDDGSSDDHAAFYETGTAEGVSPMLDYRRIWGLEPGSHVRITIEKLEDEG